MPEPHPAIDDTPEAKKAAPTASRAPQFIQIIDDSAVIEYRQYFADADRFSESVIKVTPLSDARKDVIMKAHTTTKIKRGGRVVEKTNWPAWTLQVLDEAIVGWDGVFYAGTKVPVPCTKELKGKLPEVVKADIIRIAVGREALPTQADEEDEAEGNS